MATLLLIVIYIAFIGLGIPDSLFGAAWPAIYTELGLVWIRRHHCRELQPDSGGLLGVFHLRQYAVALFVRGSPGPGGRLH